VVLLFDSAVRFLHRAQEAMRRGDYEGQCTDIIRTQKIFSTLMTSLDTSLAPQLTGSLRALYNWLHAQLTEASIRDDLPLLEQVTNITSNLRNAWRQAEANCRMEERAAAHETASPAPGSSSRHAA
jgi:flagellar protein FliS